MVSARDVVELRALCRAIPDAVASYRARRQALFSHYLEYRRTAPGTQIRYELGVKRSAASAYLRERISVAHKFELHEHPDLVITYAEMRNSPVAAFGVPRNFRLLRGGVEVEEFSEPHVAALRVNDGIVRTADAAERLTLAVGHLLDKAKSLNLAADTSALVVFLETVPWTPFFYHDENHTLSGPSGTETKESLREILDEEAPRVQALIEAAHRIERSIDTVRSGPIALPIALAPEQMKLLWLQLYLDQNPNASLREIADAAKDAGHALSKSSVNKVLADHAWMGHLPRGHGHNGGTVAHDDGRDGDDDVRPRR